MISKFYQRGKTLFCKDWLNTQIEEYFGLRSKGCAKPSDQAPYLTIRIGHPTQAINQGNLADVFKRARA
jgi:hypothetical protein